LFGRHVSASLMGRLMSLALDEIDHGMLLIDEDRRVLHCNHAARIELASSHPLVLQDSALHTRDPADLEALEDALNAAERRGLRRLLALGLGRYRTGISIVPLPGAAGEASPKATLLVLSKRQFCNALSVQGYARAHRLSAGEEQVLAGLCDGASPSGLAELHGVAISTVRSQISSIRAKTRTASIRELIQQVAVLPPLVGALRGSAAPKQPRSTPLPTSPELAPSQAAAA
jgi:DNA-binding CsgD family transcriptional regulator